MTFYVEPVGHRSCCRQHQGTPDDYMNKWLQHSSCEAELELLRNKKFDTEMSEIEQIDALEILHGLIELGAHADLRFPTGYSRRVEDEVDQIQARGRTYLLELRHVPYGDEKKVFGRAKRVLRLYYFEPMQLSKTLAALKLGSKPGDAPDTMYEQDSHIEDAHDRCQEWLSIGMDHGGVDRHDEINS